MVEGYTLRAPASFPQTKKTNDLRKRPLAALSVVCVAAYTIRLYYINLLLRNYDVASVYRVEMVISARIVFCYECVCIICGVY